MHSRKFGKMYDFERSWERQMGDVGYIYFLSFVICAPFAFFVPHLWLLIIVSMPIMLAALFLPAIIRLFWSKEEKWQYKAYAERQKEIHEYWKDRARSGH
ncbi:MAG: hypothetical protein UX13_C0004G0015 [Candidatus Woesebacteria bacterium GW2011_GWB1_45_5]|uniref:Uncharacterized protein n=1 Tax=Candidatus Woesebacteria bacterium GW2011_GWB1_45_5 TaxID=1618581 RepID=A0A0G1PZ81_9BACT|nr:MAG: hypothetical protein UX13_C0004G0015 [Candidatus Woesebacteria bacterium GW2011_GWB1_45_5]